MSAPRLARLLLRLAVPRDRRDDALGDLEEAHRAQFGPEQEIGIRGRSLVEDDTLLPTQDINGD